MAGVIVAGGSAAGSPAQAPPPQQFVGIGAVLGGSHNDANGEPTFGTANAGLAIEVGQSVEDDLFIHGQLTAGGGVEPAGGGMFVLAQAGVEGRVCGIERCGLFALDVGYQHEDYGEGGLDTPRVIPRIGLDVGGPTVRFRPSLAVSLGIPGAFEANAETYSVFVNLVVAWQGT